MKINSGWLKNFKLLKEYLREYHGKYPKNSEVYKGIKLGYWVAKQRDIYRNGIELENGSLCYNNHYLSKEQIKKLNEINFIWNNNTTDTIWDENFELFKQFLKESNGVYPKDIQIYKKRNIGTWVIKQRAIYLNGKKSKRWIIML